MMKYRFESSSTVYSVDVAEGCDIRTAILDSIFGLGERKCDLLLLEEGSVYVFRRTYAKQVTREVKIVKIKKRKRRWKSKSPVKKRWRSPSRD